PTLHGMVELTIPAGIQSGKFLRIKGKGVPILGRSERGDHIVEIQVETPLKLNSKQKGFLKDLENEEGAQHYPMVENFRKYLSNYESE
ncbi:MAG: DnaJ C-terminal domain-containing protein, partial [Bdellovibrionota bacterium]|nr:DnaJ C-terminal domain-containing protein [Bdellovibrionota bacterium]